MNAWLGSCAVNACGFRVQTPSTIGKAAFGDAKANLVKRCLLGLCGKPAQCWMASAVESEVEVEVEWFREYQKRVV
jgi:hypothetical protein